MIEDDRDVLIGREDKIALHIAPPVVDAYGTIEFPVRLSGRGLTAVGRLEVEQWHDGTDSLAAYFDDLAAGWRGWSGSKAWRDDSGELEMAATHNGIGLVTLRVSVSNRSWDRAGTWRAEVNVPVEPGTLEAIAKKVRSLST